MDDHSKTPCFVGVVQIPVRPGEVGPLGRYQKMNWHE